MIDTHYDLLTIAYVAYLKNDYSYLEKISKYFNEKNVTGVIANLYFMSLDEMRDELHPDYYREDVSVLEMFKIAKKVLDTYLPDTNILYSIEGADYIKDSDELRGLKEAGLDALIMCWNTKSKYASGNRSNQGLTTEGKELLETAIDLGLGIDLSHANKETFNDIITTIGDRNVCVYASHSNSRSLCDRERNLDDEQLLKLKNIGGLVGVFSNRNFIVDNSIKDTVSEEEKYQKYIEHIDYISSIVGFDHVMVATDDMDFCKDVDPEYGETSIYDYENIASLLISQLDRKYGYEVAYKIICGNALDKVFNRIRNKKNNNIRTH